MENRVFNHINGLAHFLRRTTHKRADFGVSQMQHFRDGGGNIEGENINDLAHFGREAHFSSGLREDGKCRFVARKVNKTRLEDAGNPPSVGTLVAVFMVVCRGGLVPRIGALGWSPLIVRWLFTGPSGALWGLDHQAVIHLELGVNSGRTKNRRFSG